MTTPRIFRDALQETVKLTAEEFHHFSSVLRLADGHPVEIVALTSKELFEGKLQIASSSVHSLERRQCTVPTSSCIISVALPLLKGGGAEDLIDCVTQLGVDNIYVFEAKHSVARFSRNDKSPRLQARAVAAASQSKQLHIPNVSTVQSLEALLATKHDARILCCALTKDATSLNKQAVQEAHELLIVSGPEGDFSEEEYAHLKARNARFVTLGRSILRANLAPIVAVVQVQYLIQGT